MLMTGLGYSFLHEHCALEFSTENIVCWKKIDTYTMNKPTFHGFEVCHSADQWVLDVQCQTAIDFGSQSPHHDNHSAPPPAQSFATS